MIPAEKTAAVSRALQQTFGTTQFDDAQKMTRGLSSDIVLRIVVQGSPYLMRIMTRNDEQMDPTRIFACMNAASAAGLTPRVLYTSVEDGISITDFLEAVPLSQAQAFELLPHTLRNLHALPPFPKAFNHTTSHNAFIWRFRKSGLLPTDEIESVFSRYEQICAAYPRLDADMVSSHMDLKPENMLFDGQRLWLVDWQAGFLNDRYFDLSVPANFLLTSDADELIWLERYFGHPPSQYQCARFHLMRQAVHLFYATVFLLLGSAGKPIQPPASLPSFADFHQQLWRGELNVMDQDTRILYGLIHWTRLLHNLQQPRFEEALQTITAQHAADPATPRLFPPAP